VSDFNSLLKKLYGPKKALLSGRVHGIEDLVYGPSPFIALMRGEKPEPKLPEDDELTLSSVFHEEDCFWVESRRGDVDYCDMDTDPPREASAEDLEYDADEITLCSCGAAEKQAWRHVAVVLDDHFDPGYRAWRDLFWWVDLYWIT
jgi:hypothetical protein